MPSPEDELRIDSVADVHAVRDDLRRCGIRCVAGANAAMAVAGVASDIGPEWDVVRGEFDLHQWPDQTYTRWIGCDEHG